MAWTRDRSSSSLRTAINGAEPDHDGAPQSGRSGRPGHVFRNDLASKANPATPKNPHTFLTRINVPSVASFAIGAQQQIAAFFASDGTATIDPDDTGAFFETPIKGAL